MDKRKYIIELPDDEHLISWWTYIGTEDGKQHIDFHEVVKTPYDLDAIKQEAYQNGLNDAWEAARKICTNWVLSDIVLSKIFGIDKTIDDVMKENTASEAIEKIRQYEQEQKKIKVGDEVDGKGGRGIITKISDDSDHFNVMWENGSTGYYMIEDFKKTGRHFPEIAEVLKRMQEETA